MSWSFLRAAALLDVGLFALVGVTCLAIGQCSLALYALLLRWASIAILLVTGLTVAGGVASRVEDVAAYSLTGAGKMSDHLRRLSQETGGRFGCVIPAVLAGIIALGVGFLLQFVVDLSTAR